jgi:RNA polymerase sigma-70 factor, ECF subfamily
MNYSIAWPDDVPVARSESDGGEVIDINAAKTDQQLVDLVLAGDESAFEQIFERHKRHVAIVAGRYFQAAEQMEEIVQTCFVKAYFELKNFRGRHDYSLMSWLGRIATNACLDHLRTRKRKPANLVSELSEAEQALFADALAKDDKCAETDFIHRDLAEKLLSNLDGEDRAILQMLYAEEMSVAQVRELTGWSSAKIKSRAFRARHSLQKVLKRFS